MATLLTVAVKVRSRNRVDDSQYYNEDGDHIYYDRSRIEKKRFREKNPDVRDVRSFRRLFREFRDDRQDAPNCLRSNHGQSDKSG